MDPAKFRAQRRGPRHSRIHVQPDAVLPTDGANFGQGIKCHGRSGAHRGADEAGNQSGALIFGDSAHQRLREHGKFLVYFNDSQILAPNAGDLDRLLDRRMGLGRGVGSKPAIATGFIRREARGSLAASEHAAQIRAGSRILDHAAAVAAGGQKLRRQAQHLHQPIEHADLQLGAGWAGNPKHALHA